MYSHSDVILKLSPWLLEGETKRKMCWQGRGARGTAADRGDDKEATREKVKAAAKPELARKTQPRRLYT